MSTKDPLPETNVLAVASHVVSGNVGNKIAVFVLQSMGCEVAALNTVQFSNHTGYRQWKGTRVSAQEITDLWEGLKMSFLDGFDMMLSGYVPGAAAVEAVGAIAKELRHKSEDSEYGGSFFWVLDPVMGDNGRLYVADDVVPAYKSLLSYADLILPNQFEAELLSGVKITDSASLEHAIEVLHRDYGVPHIVITSVSLPLSSTSSPTPSPSSPSETRPRTMSVVGSSMTSDRKPRLFRISFPVFDCYFSGTGDMFAALMVARLREAVARHDTTTVHHPASPEGAIPVASKRSWLCADGLHDPRTLPLARAAEMVLASMHEVLARTCDGLQDEVRKIRQRERKEGLDEKTVHLLTSRAAELKLARNLTCLRDPKVQYRAEKM
ncbi:Ribokinase-like protein [Hypoxylon fuscum]|nr:Ribokinase-like protein [Hypoxylon fuscum]